MATLELDQFFTQSFTVANRLLKNFTNQSIYCELYMRLFHHLFNGGPVDTPYTCQICHFTTDGVVTFTVDYKTRPVMVVQIQADGNLEDIRRLRESDDLLKG